MQDLAIQSYRVYMGMPVCSIRFYNPSNYKISLVVKMDVPSSFTLISMMDKNMDALWQTFLYIYIDSYGKSPASIGKSTISMGHFQ